MMDIRPLVASPDSVNSSSDITPFLSLFAPLEASTMIIDTTSNNSTSMPVSPKQGETITAESISEQDKQLVSSSMTPISWDLLSAQPTSSLCSASSLHTSAVLGGSWTSTPPKFSLPLAHIQTVKDSLAMVNSYQTNQINSETSCHSWTDGKEAPKSSTTTSSSSESPSPNHLHSPSKKREDIEDPDELPTTTISSSTLLTRNCDQPDSSPSPQSHLSSSFDESEQPGAELSVHNAESFGANNMNLFGGLERRSRRKPTIGDIIRRVRPPVDAPLYDSEESEIEDDILQDELMAKMNQRHHTDEVDGSSKPFIKLENDGKYGEEDSRQLTVNRLSRLEAVDGIPEDDDEDEDMEVQSETDSLTESDKHSFLNDVPESIYNLMHEAKVNAHTMFMKTANSQSPNEAKAFKEQYLLQQLSNLRDRCLDEGLKPDIISAVLKDVETEVAYLSEYLEDMKMKHYYPDSDKESSFIGLDSHESHFLSKPNIKLEHDKDRAEFSSFESSYSSIQPPSFFHTSSTSSPMPTSSSSSPVTSSDSKPIIMTVSADVKPSPPLMYTTGGLPAYHPMTANVSEQALSPLFPSGKLGPWFPHMAMCNFGSPGKFDFANKFMNLDGKISDNLDKDYLKCQFCERTFRRQKNLENHIENTHQGKGQLKPRRETTDMYFKCSHCPYTTKHQSNLYVHLRIHTGERPYICGACGVQYSQSHSLKSHIINKHDGIMSFYYKEKRARSPRGLGYLSAQVMHDGNMFKLPGPVMGSHMHHNLDIVNKAIEMATSENMKHHLKQQQHLSPPGTDFGSHRNIMPPPLNSIISNGNSSVSSNSNTQSNTDKSLIAPSSGVGSGLNTSTVNSMFSPPGAGLHPPFFMNGHPLLFGDFMPHIHNPNQFGSGHQPTAPHPFMPGFPHFSRTSSTKFHGSTGLSPLPGLSPSSSPALSSSNSHHNLTQHLQLPVPLPHISPSPIPLLQQQQIKREPSVTPSTPVSTKQSTNNQTDEAIDLRKKSPPLDIKEFHAHDLSTCGGKENCPHAARLKYLRLNVVRMLGILVPNLNFAEKGISAESESVDELLQDVIESNTHDDDIPE